MNFLKAVASIIFVGMLIITGCTSADITEPNFQISKTKEANPQPVDTPNMQKSKEYGIFITVQSEVPMNSEESSPETTEEPKKPQTAPSNQMHMLNANFNIGVYDAELIKSRIIESANAKGGYLQQEGNLKLVIHVPAEHFQSIADEISNYGRIIDKNIFSRDVTENLIDLTTLARVRNESLNILREMLKKTETKDDMLNVLREIRFLQDEIDKVEGQRRFILARVNKSVIEINFRLEHQMVSAPSKIKLPIDWLYRHSLEFLMGIR